MSEETPEAVPGILSGIGAGSRIARYVLEEQIGAGGMAVVFRALDERLGRRVALKVLAPALAADQAFRERFLRESHAAAAVDDPHIIPVFEAGESGGVLFIAMRFVPGGDVRTMLHREGPLSAARVAAIISPVASALDAAHAAGLVHRDVKPANILVDARPDRPDHVYLSDFGLSKGAQSSSGLTGSGQFLGTPNYSAPEQIEGRPVDGRTDQYALACVAFELLCGEAPFDRDQGMAVIWAHLSQPPPSLTSRRPDLRAAADEVFARALAKAPGDRYADCHEFADALRDALGLVPYQSGPGQVPGAHPVIEVNDIPAGRPDAVPAGAAAPDPPTETVVPVKRSPSGSEYPPITPVPAVPLRPIVGAGDRMLPPGHRSRAGPVTVALAVLVACAAAVAGVLSLASGGARPHHGPGATTSTAARPVYGGTLKVAAAGGPDHIDPIPSYYSADYVLERAYTRQLVSYPTVPDPVAPSAGWTKDTTPMTDVATVVPTTANGGITNGGTTYTFHIKPGVDWNTTPPRQVAAADFVREFKAFCDPVSPVGTPTYYTETIQGLGQYCNAEGASFSGITSPTAAQITAFQNSHSISGISAPNASTLVFHLIKPASDFLDMLAMEWASARPAEYDAYVPDSAQLDQHTISDGPYQITTYLAGQSIVLTRNPAWRQSTDNLRHQYLSKIVVTLGLNDPFSNIQAGNYDLSLDISPLPSEIATLQANHDPKFGIWPGGDMDPYVVFNLRSPNQGGAIGNVLVRQAIEYGISKLGVRQALGPSAASQIISDAIAPGEPGYQAYNLYPSPGSQGDPAMCRGLLTRSGHSGLTLNYIYPQTGSSGNVEEAIAASLARCGITVRGKAVSIQNYYVDLTNAPANGKPGTFDLGQGVWFPDWFGEAARTVLALLFQTDCTNGTVNYGCYSNPAVDTLIARAEAAPDAATAAALTHQADLLIMRDAAFVPLTSQNCLTYSSKKVEAANASAIVCTPNIGGPDITNIWLRNG